MQIVKLAKKRKLQLFSAIALIIAIIIVGVYMHLNAKTKLEAGIPHQEVLSAQARTTHVAKPLTTQAPTKALLSRIVYLGMWTGGLWDDKALTFHPEALQTVESKIGKKVAIAHFYTGWSNLTSPAFINQLNIVSNNGWRPMVSVNPYFSDQCQARGMTIYKAIAAGNCDDFLKSVGVSLKQYGKPLFLRFAWEMNIPSMDWSIQKTGSSPSDYIAAWRHFHDIVIAQGATNVIWVFAPNTTSSTSIPYGELYPGDSYVDWVGLDGYNWGTTQTWSSWQSFSQVFSTSYRLITTVAPDKPLMLSEVNSADAGGDKAAWYNDMLTTQIPDNYPRISAVVFYNEDRTTQEKVNWLIDSSQASLQAFIKGVSNPLYSSSF